MKYFILLLALDLFLPSHSIAQSLLPSEIQTKQLHELIDAYSRARESRDTILLKTILTADVDQLVSTGEWRNGLAASVKGMQQSSASTPGTRTLTVDKIRLITPACAIVDCKYEIQNADGTSRKMWSTFVAVEQKGKWKISAIRNMLPGKG